eukprot:CAMPEP_0196824052 /NCGR_PEP_ID=MMETSP1362-20130617/90197_1 /TAXON_ID=163516 /ORGANISM="Leptocylindrus danicus, Strain CCMP1856" /LENGTH=716 /DNA_ID=CAMNT_0042204169 /DNA_START=214 /DNA_END=2364 /DNA_ORIENTATION=+
MANDEIWCAPTPSPSDSVQPSPVPTRMNIQTASPTSCGEAIDRKSKIHERLLAISGTSNLEDSESAQYRAFEWLVYDDERRLCSDELGLEQRYIIAVFYFSLSLSGWEFCGVDVGERVVAGYSSCVEGNARFLSKAHECSWFGIGCDGDLDVSSIQLAANGLQGSIASELQFLPHLTRIDLSSNLITGRIPERLGHLHSLESLNLSSNSIEAILPEEIFASQSLQHINLSGNSFTGSIPSAIGSLNSLETLFLHHNQLSGSVDEAICALKSLKLDALWVDCLDSASNDYFVQCNCCTNCLAGSGSLPSPSLAPTVSIPTNSPEHPSYFPTIKPSKIFQLPNGSGEISCDDNHSGAVFFTTNVEYSYEVEIYSGSEIDAVVEDIEEMLLDLIGPDLLVCNFRKSIRRNRKLEIVGLGALPRDKVTSSQPCSSTATTTSSNICATIDGSMSITLNEGDIHLLQQKALAQIKAVMDDMSLLDHVQSNAIVGVKYIGPTVTVVEETSKDFSSVHSQAESSSKSGPSSLVAYLVLGASIAFFISVATVVFVYYRRTKISSIISKSSEETDISDHVSNPFQLSGHIGHQMSPKRTSLRRKKSKKPPARPTTNKIIFNFDQYEMSQQAPDENPDFMPDTDSHPKWFLHRISEAESESEDESSVQVLDESDAFSDMSDDFDLFDAKHGKADLLRDFTTIEHDDDRWSEFDSPKANFSFENSEFV